MPTTISRWGNSLAIRIPAAEAEKAALREGDKVELSALEQGKLLVEAVRGEIDFEALYARITPENRHDEVAWGDSLGNETAAW
jgi:antitoxin MazE